MEKLTLNHPDTQSADIVADNIDKLKALFPDAFLEGAIQFDSLKQLLGSSVDEREEKYGLNWHGKRRAKQIALTPSTGTLRPCPEDSVDWEATQNLMIEGDNLEVLKLLQKSYAGKIKLIYIDPPYNTGKDFVYPDDFRDNIRNYLELTGQSKGRQKLTTNTEANGRFHTEWLNMMYPRLRLARSLLSEDGVICISLDDAEIDNLRKLASEIFGEENFIAQILWKKRSTPPNDKIIGANHDYITVFCKNKEAVGLNLKERSKDQIDRYKNPDNHPKGPWVAGDLMANIKGGRYVESLNYPIINPKTGKSHLPSETERGNWRFSKETIEKLIANDELYFGEDGRGRPKLKRFLADVKDGVTYSTIWDFVPFNTEGSGEMHKIFGNSAVFESPKPVGLVEEILKLGSYKDSIILDFFAGSGTTAHATLSLNKKDSGSRKYILVQLPEKLDPEKSEQKTAADFCKAIGKPNYLTELTKERLRRASNMVKIESGILPGDTGFRVFKLDSSNIRSWDPNRDDLPASLFDAMEHIKDGRTENDILFELLLKLGLDLVVPIENKIINGKVVHSIGAGALLVCLATSITQPEAEALALGMIAWHEEQAPAGETTVVFRDSAFADDVTKTNLAAILGQHGLTTVRSL